MQKDNPQVTSHLLNVKPHIPLRPVLSAEVFGRETSYCGTILDTGAAILTKNARTALALALRHANIEPGSSILIPAYHCPAMVSPLVWLGLKPIFFPIRPDTTVDVNILANYLQPETRALIAVHYFGFIQDMRPLRQFCDEHRLVLIEDCAHAFFGNINGQGVGSQGDYAIASIMKFLPVYEGGCLVSSRRSLASLKTKQGGFFDQLKSALNTVEMAHEYGRLSWLSPLLKAKDRLWLRFKKSRERGEVLAQEGTGQDSAEFVFNPTDLTVSMSWSSIAIMHNMSFSRACIQRLANYKKLYQALHDVAGGHPLFTHLPDGVYPQVFPMVMDNPHIAFPILKQKGVPIIRFGEFLWKGVDESICPVSEEFSRRVFQFPCHQSLSTEELDWMIAIILSVLNESN